MSVKWEFTELILQKLKLFISFIQYSNLDLKHADIEASKEMKQKKPSFDRQIILINYTHLCILLEV